MPAPIRGNHERETDGASFGRPKARSSICGIVFSSRQQAVRLCPQPRLLRSPGAAGSGDGACVRGLPQAACPGVGLSPEACLTLSVLLHISVAPPSVFVTAVVADT